MSALIGRYSRRLCPPTFGSIGSFVVTLSKPSEVLVLNPWHPLLVLIVIGFSRPLVVGLLLLGVVARKLVCGVIWNAHCAT